MNPEPFRQRKNPQLLIASHDPNLLKQLHFRLHFPPHPTTPNGQPTAKDLVAQSRPKILKRYTPKGGPEFSSVLTAGDVGGGQAVDSGLADGFAVALVFVVGGDVADGFVEAHRVVFVADRVRVRRRERLGR